MCYRPLGRGQLTPRRVMWAVPAVPGRTGFLLFSWVRPGPRPPCCEAATQAWCARQASASPTSAHLCPAAGVLLASGMEAALPSQQPSQVLPRWLPVCHRGSGWGLSRNLGVLPALLCCFLVGFHAWPQALSLRGWACPLPLPGTQAAPVPGWKGPRSYLVPAHTASRIGPGAGDKGRGCSP